MIRATALLLALLSAPALTQVPPDHMLIDTSQINGEPTLSGLFFVTPSGHATRLSGYLAVPQALVIDPYDATVWNNPAVVRITMTGAAITNAVRFATLPRASIGGFTQFDVDGHLLVYTRDYNAIPLLYRVDRETGAWTILQDGTIRYFAAMDMDPTTWRLYFAANPIGPYPNRDVYYLDPPYTGQPVLVGTIGSAIPVGSVISGLQVAPFLSPPQLYLLFSGRQFTRMDPATGNLTLLSQVGGLIGSALWRHERSQRFYSIIGGQGPDSVYRVDQNGAVSTVVNLGLFGSPGPLAVNGFVPGSLYVAPMNVPSRAFLFEAGVWGRPGELAVLAITQPIVALVATGITNPAGVLPVKLQIPAGTITPGNPGAIEFVAATIDPMSLSVRMSQPKRWPLN